MVRFKLTLVSYKLTSVIIGTSKKLEFCNDGEVGVEHDKVKSDEIVGAVVFQFDGVVSPGWRTCQQELL